MKLSHAIFISKANLKGSKKEKTILVFMILSIIAVSVLIGYTQLINNIMSQFENRLILKQIFIQPLTVYPDTTISGVTKDNVADILSMEHVVSGTPQPYDNYNYITFAKITDDNGCDISNSGEEYNLETLSNAITTYYVDEELSIKSIQGQQLKDAPVMSCIVPDRGMIIYDIYKDKYYTVDTAGLLGKTISINCDYNMLITQSQPQGGTWVIMKQ